MCSMAVHINQTGHISHVQPFLMQKFASFVSPPVQQHFSHLAAAIVTTHSLDVPFRNRPIYLFKSMTESAQCVYSTYFPKIKEFFI